MSVINSTAIIRICVLAILFVAAIQCVSADTKNKGKNDTIEVGTNDPDSGRPLLKRLFKDFPTVYSDTAYTDTDYVVVIRCVLTNTRWHVHNHPKAIPVDGTIRREAKEHLDTMVRFESN